MQVTVRGWARDHGAKDLLTAELRDVPVTEQIDRYARGDTYFEVKRTVSELPRGRRKVQYTIRVSAHAELNLNGSYLVRLELDRDEIARLFYLTNGDRELPELLQTFSAFKRQEDLGFAPERGG
jgi:hypothetical protein